jgi:hypothetical protein
MHVALGDQGVNPVARLSRMVKVSLNHPAR